MPNHEYIDKFYNEHQHMPWQIPCPICNWCVACEKKEQEWSTNRPLECTNCEGCGYI
jgi:hypothetical protein